MPRCILRHLMLTESAASALATIILGMSDFFERLLIIPWLFYPCLFDFANEASHTLNPGYLSGTKGLCLLPHPHPPSYVATEVLPRRAVFGLYSPKSTFFGLTLFFLAIKNYHKVGLTYNKKFVRYKSFLKLTITSGSNLGSIHFQSINSACFVFKFISLSSPKNLVIYHFCF